VVKDMEKIVVVGAIATAIGAAAGFKMALGL